MLRFHAAAASLLVGDHPSARSKHPSQMYLYPGAPSAALSCSLGAMRHTGQCLILIPPPFAVPLS